MRTNLEHSNIYEARHSGLRLANVATTISDTYVVPTEGPSVYVLNGGIADRTVRLPPLTRDKQIVIGNVGSTNSFNVTDSLGNALFTITANNSAILFSGTSRWIWTTASFLNTIATTLVVASGNVAATDVEVQVNGAGAVVLTLPDSVLWASTAGWTGLPLSIYDISGAASANNITINPSGGQTISGQASLTISADYGGYNLRPKNGGGWYFR